MNSHFERGRLLLQQRRFDEAIGELQLHLAHDSDNSSTHSLLSLAFLGLEKHAEATEHAQRAIHLAPDESLGHYALAVVLDERNRLADARAAIEEAIRLDPYNPDYFALLAGLHLQQYRWREALDAANAGLEIEPEHNLCTNFRAQALIKLGNRAEAAQTIGDALARRPDDALTHANQGWAMLHQGEPYKALEHFREALRLNPELEFARAGIVEAMKARNFIYRWMLGYFLWMARLPPRVQWGLVIGAYFGNRIVRGYARENPELAPFLLPLLYAYFAFVLLSWLADPFFNLLLRLNRFGRHALSRDQIRGANVLLACLVATIGFLIAAIVRMDAVLFYATVMFALLALPASAIFRSAAGWPRNAMAAITLGLLVAVLGVVIPILLIPEEELPKQVLSLMLILPIGMLLSQIAANVLMATRVRR